MFTTRSSGILLHPTSFPGPYGIGDLGDEAYRFVDWLAAAGQKWWQILPLNPTWEDGSPYKSPAAFAGNPLLISPDKLVHDGLLSASDVDRLRRSHERWGERVDYSQVGEEKATLHAAAFASFQSAGPSHPLSVLFEEFRSRSSNWLESYAQFLAARESNGGRPWFEWRNGNEGLQVATADDSAGERAAFFAFEQFLFHRQWGELRSYAAGRGVQIIGDLPIYVAHDSADVWADRENFLLDERGYPTEVAGVPPDYFSATGQLWNNPIYNWPLLATRGYDWWIRRIHATLDVVDVARIDHFRGFAAYWSVPAGETTAVNGRWIPGPGAVLFEAIRQSLLGRSPGHSLPLIAEDLGTITPDVVWLRKQFDLPGMRVLQFEVLDGSDRAMQVDKYESDTVVYTGTHDNDTTRGWYDTDVAPHEWRLRRLKEFLPFQAETIAWDLIEMAWSSSGILAVAPLQDVLSLDSDARMNTPGTTSQEKPNWQWRYAPGSLTPDLADRLAQLTAKHHRR